MGRAAVTRTIISGVPDRGRWVPLRWNGSGGRHRSHAGSPNARGWPTPSKWVLAKPQEGQWRVSLRLQADVNFRYRAVRTGSRRVGRLHSADGPTFQLEPIAITVCGKLQNDCLEPQAGCIARAACKVSIECRPSPVEVLSKFLERIGIVGGAVAKRRVVHDGTPIRALEKSGGEFGGGLGGAQA